ncbi:DeoR/GlpR transcriptional regulator [Candidatus Sumerlaeota bacterium]|nr:DeoR/GlpR transcriptional regulator [Candidatus Sumerlaeota bacterium]
MSSSTDQRHERILGEVYEKGRAAVKDLAVSLSVSEATVRRDLKKLAGNGRIELIYGGATLARPSDFSFHSKEMRHIQDKRLIGRLAARLISNNDQIFLDSGTTCFQIASHIKMKRNLTVMANSARLATELSAPGLNVVLLGGQYRPDRMDTVGPLTTRTLENLRGYVAFIGCDGLSMDFGLTASDIDSAHLHALVIANSRETVLVADHSKFAAPSLYRIVGFESLTRIVTDRRPDEEWMQFLGERGIEVVCPDSEEGS